MQPGNFMAMVSAFLSLFSWELGTLNSARENPSKLKSIAKPKHVLHPATRHEPCALFSVAIDQAMFYNL